MKEGNVSKTVSQKEARLRGNFEILANFIFRRSFFTVTPL